MYAYVSLSFTIPKVCNISSSYSSDFLHAYVQYLQFSVINTLRNYKVVMCYFLTQKIISKHCIHFLTNKKYLSSRAAWKKNNEKNERISRCHFFVLLRLFVCHTALESQYLAQGQTDRLTKKRTDSQTDGHLSVYIFLLLHLLYYLFVCILFRYVFYMIDNCHLGGILGTEGSLFAVHIHTYILTGSIIIQLYLQR